MKTKRIQAKEEVSHRLNIHPAMKSNVGYCLFKLGLRYRALMDSKLVEHGLVAPQCGIISLLDRTGPMTQIELGRYILIDKATMVRLLDGLEAKKFLVRITDPQDRRAKKLELTGAGRKFLQTVQALIAQVDDSLLGVLSKKERDTLKDLVSKIVLQES